MTAVGAVLAALAVGLLVAGLRRPTGVARALAAMGPAGERTLLRQAATADRELRLAGSTLGHERFMALKVVAALSCAVAASLLALLLPLGPLAVAIAAYMGYVAPSIVVEQRVAARRRAADAAVSVLVDRLEALVLAGRPPEAALATLVRRPSGAALLDDVTRGADEAYRLGAPLFRTLAAHARERSLFSCAQVAEDLERARDLGAGSIGVIAERRSALRAAERARRLEAAAGVEGKLMLTLVLCYLPALLLLVVIPLFVGLLDGLVA
jgi:pilus assembly protein TadC